MTPAINIQAKPTPVLFVTTGEGGRHLTDEDSNRLTDEDNNELTDS